MRRLTIGSVLAAEVAAAAVGVGVPARGAMANAIAPVAVSAAGLMTMLAEEALR